MDHPSVASAAHPLEIPVSLEQGDVSTHRRQIDAHGRRERADGGKLRLPRALDEAQRLELFERQIAAARVRSAAAHDLARHPRQESREPFGLGHVNCMYAASNGWVSTGSALFAA